MAAFIQLYLASLKEFVRDRMAMFWTLAFPIFFIVIFGIIFSGNNDTVFDIGLAVLSAHHEGRYVGFVFE